MTKETLGHSFKAIDMGDNSYASPEMIEFEQIECYAALERVSIRMARTTLNNMLHLDAAAADVHGGEEQLFDKLKLAYRENLLTNDM